MRKLKGFALRGRMVMAFFVLAVCAGALGAFIPKMHFAFAENDAQAAVSATEQVPRAEGDVEVAAPVLEGEAERFYNGNEHSFGVTGYEKECMEYTVTGPAQAAVLGNTVTFKATEANNYQVTFTLKSGYVWASGEESETIGFSITKATDQTITLDAEYCFAYGEEIEIVPTLKYPAAENNISISYYTYGNADAPFGDYLGNVKPVNAGVYYAWVTVPGTSNYVQAQTGVVVVIEKKQLSVSVTVNVPYGQKIAESDIHYSIEGFAYDETAEDRVTVNLALFAQSILYGNGEGPATMGSHTPEFITDDVTVNAYTDATAKNLKGFFKKGNADNYYFTAANNCQVFVSKLPVSVVIGNASGTYGSSPQFNSGITLRWAVSTANNRIPEADKAKENGELMELLNISANSFLCSATSTSDVGSYPIQIVNWKNDNYSVTFVDGSYEIVPASLLVEWSEGGGSYHNVVAPEITSIQTLFDGAFQPLKGDFEAAVRAGLCFRFIDITGNQSFKAGEVPQNAGNYSVELTFTTEGKIGKNYVLSAKSAASRRFSISKLTLDVQKLRIDDDEKLVYNNGNTLVPTLITGGLEEFFDVEIDEAKVVGTYYITLTIKDFDNVQWSVGKTAEYKVPFNVTKAKNMIIDSIIIEGWTYGDVAKIPSVTLSNTKDISDGVDILPIFEYSSDNGENWTNVVPTAAGSYLVRATTKGTTNVEAYASLSATPFSIARKPIAKPQLDVTAANNVYTGKDLHANASGFDQTLMTFTYKGSFTVNGSNIALTVRDAGAYKLTVELFDPNYVWADGDEERVYEQTWTIAPKRLEKPTAGTNSFPSTDKVITYVPDGFDANTMTITGNKAGYSDTFTAEISLKDSANYVWDDGTVESIRLEWKIGGVNKTFAALISVFAVLVALGVGAGVMQYVLFKRKQNREAIIDEHEEGEQSEEKSEGGEQA